MPTGYTADLYDLKPITRNEFILQCARAFGATIEQRDEPLSNPPTLRSTNDYTDKNIARAKERIWFVSYWSEQTIAEEAELAYQRDFKAWSEGASKALARRVKYEQMLSDVTAWKPPTPKHEELKKFMIDQLESSIEWDCKIYPSPARITPKEYAEQEIKAAERDLEYYTQAKEREQNNVDESNDWIRALYKSLEE
jgi:transposase